MADWICDSSGSVTESGTPSAKLVMIASAALLLGVAVYLFDRPAAQIYFVPDWLSSLSQPLYLFGSLANHLPTFFHVFAFSLFTVAVIGISKSKVSFSCFGWWLVDSLFEIAQYDSLAVIITKHLPAWFDHIPFLEAAPAYFLNGRFDAVDLFSIFLGAVAAFICISLISTKEEASHE